MKIFLHHWKWTGVLFVALTVLLLTVACGEEEKPTLRLADTQFESLWINNAVAQFIIENGYGYPTETIETTTPIAQATLANGEIDIWMELWQQNWIDNYNEETAKGNIINTGMTYEGGPQFWVVPKYTADEHNLRTVDDLKDPQIAKLFQDPEDSSKGGFINCPIGWQCEAINEAKFEAYGLDQYYNVITPGSAGALDAALAGPQKKQEPVFGYYWAPTALMGLFEWQVLEEPSYSNECWEEVAKGQDDRSYTPKQACAYETLPIDKGVTKTLPDRASDVYEMLKKMVVGLDAINKTAAWSNENDVQDYSKAAVYYLQNFEDRWTTWMPSDKVKKVKEALAKSAQ